VGQNVYFSYLAKLEEGKNAFVIEAWDLPGNRTKKKVEFHRRLQKVRYIGSRLSVALLPMERKGTAAFTADAVEEGLLTELISGHRFQVVERRRLEEILREQKLSASELADPMQPRASAGSWRQIVCLWGHCWRRVPCKWVENDWTKPNFAWKGDRQWY
jgi:hypothetical protein